jgi:hypothetical protein
MLLYLDESHCRYVECMLIPLLLWGINNILFWAYYSRYVRQSNEQVAVIRTTSRTKDLQCYVGI